VQFFARTDAALPEAAGQRSVNPPSKKHFSIGQTII